MYSFQWFWMNFTFIFPYLFGAMIVTAKAEKKRFWLLGYLLSFLILWGWTFLWEYICSIVPDEVGDNIFFLY